MKIGKTSIAELVAQLKTEKEMSRDFIVPTEKLHITAEKNPTLTMYNRGAKGCLLRHYLKTRPSGFCFY